MSLLFYGLVLSIPDGQNHAVHIVAGYLYPAFRHLQNASGLCHGDKANASIALRMHKGQRIIRIWISP